MSFLKKVSRAARGLVKQVDHGLGYLDKSAHLATGLIHRSHLGYRAMKRFTSKAVPGASLAFSLLEMTPEAQLVNSTRQSAESALARVHPTISTARLGSSILNRGIQDPKLRQFIHS